MGCQKKAPMNSYFELKPVAENTLTIYVIPSPYLIDWSSPKNLLSSIAKNYFSFYPNFMGHVQVGVSCQNSKNELIEFHSGMVARSLTAKTQLIVHGAGLGVLFHSFDGRVEFQGDEAAADFDELKTFLQDPKSNQGLNFFAYKINAAQCDRLKEYHDTYLKYDLGKFYGLPNVPQKGEGAGCSAYALSYLDVLGLVSDEERAAWSGVRYVPKKFAGPPVTENYINVLSLLWKNPNWGLNEDQDHLKIFFYEPRQMYEWVENIINRQQSFKNDTWKIVQLGQRRGIINETSQYQQIPDQPLFSIGHLPWVKDFDKINQPFYQSLQRNSQEPR
jgi:hypothetical protein